MKKPAAAKTAAGRTINLDEARAARAEAAGEPVALVFDGQTFTLPIEMPADFALLAADNRFREAVAALIGPDAEKFFALRPSMADLTELASAAGEVYGINQGEAGASATS